MYSRKYSLLLVAVFLGLSLITITACGGNGAEIEWLKARVEELERLEARVEELEEKTRYLSSEGQNLHIDGNLTTYGDLTTVGTLRILPEHTTPQIFHGKQSDVMLSPVSITLRASTLSSIIRIHTLDGKSLVSLTGHNFLGGMLQLFDHDGNSKLLSTFHE